MFRRPFPMTAVATALMSRHDDNLGCNFHPTSAVGPPADFSAAQPQHHTTRVTHFPNARPSHSPLLRRLLSLAAGRRFAPPATSTSSAYPSSSSTFGKSHLFNPIQEQARYKVYLGIGGEKVQHDTMIKREDKRKEQMAVKRAKMHAKKSSRKKSTASIAEDVKEKDSLADDVLLMHLERGGTPKEGIKGGATSKKAPSSGKNGATEITNRSSDGSVGKKRGVWDRESGSRIDAKMGRKRGPGKRGSSNGQNLVGGKDNGTKKGKTTKS